MRRTEWHERFYQIVGDHEILRELVFMDMVTDRAIRDYLIVMDIKSGLQNGHSFKQMLKEVSTEYHVTTRWVREIYSNNLQFHQPDSCK